MKHNNHSWVRNDPHSRPYCQSCGMVYEEWNMTRSTYYQQPCRDHYTVETWTPPKT